MRKIQIKCLEKLGVTDVAEGADGAEGLRAFESSTFDLVMTDWNMPNMDGLTLLREIRKRNTLIPIFMITTEAERNRVVEAIQSGVSDYLVKPFTVETLKQKLEPWLTLPVIAPSPTLGGDE